MSTFRDKPHRKMSQVSNASSTQFSSIDAFHQAKTTDFQQQLPVQRSEWIDQRDALQCELDTLRAMEPYGLERIHKEYALEKMIHELTTKIETIDSGELVNDYWIQTTPLLTQYYHPQTQTDRRRERDDKEEKKTTIVEELVRTKEGIEKKMLYDRYFQMVMEPSKTSMSQHTDVDKNWSYCTTCKTEKIPIQHEGMMICPQCGFSEYTLIHSDRPCFKEKQQQEALNSYTYKRINHFNEWLSEFQAKELTIVPPEVMETIQKELKKHRLLHANIQYTDMRTILKKLHYNRYYEHIPYIMSKLTGKQAAVISKETEELLRNMFRQLQPPFEKHCPEGRSNFLSYRYVLRKMFEIIGLYDYANEMMLPKSKQKILEYDSIWYKICKDLKWPFHSTSSVRNLQPNQPTDLERLLKRKDNST